MREKKVITIFLIVLVFLLTSCNHYYSPAEDDSFIDMLKAVSELFAGEMCFEDAEKAGTDGWRYHIANYSKKQYETGIQLSVRNNVYTPLGEKADFSLIGNQCRDISLMFKKGKISVDYTKKIKIYDYELENTLWRNKILTNGAINAEPKDISLLKTADGIKELIREQFAIQNDFLISTETTAELLFAFETPVNATIYSEYLQEKSDLKITKTLIKTGNNDENFVLQLGTFPGSISAHGRIKQLKNFNNAGLSLLLSSELFGIKSDVDLSDIENYCLENDAHITGFVCEMTLPQKNVDFDSLQILGLNKVIFRQFTLIK